ncbi:FxLD family lanthipeptide [Streptomyces sp. NPDC023723]|uniref:FxLD family lanthipeptide n=1 Tax=Streptomyces sp. NPDC023723 TaxID=3154323 RepID=UPI0033FA3003
MTTAQTDRPAAPAQLDLSATDQSEPFDLDVSVLESGDGQATLINLTDDGCGSTCSSPCATNVA